MWKVPSMLAPPMSSRPLTAAAKRETCESMTSALVALITSGKPALVSVGRQLMTFSSLNKYSEPSLLSCRLMSSMPSSICTWASASMEAEPTVALEVIQRRVALPVSLLIAMARVTSPRARLAPALTVADRPLPPNSNMFTLAVLPSLSVTLWFCRDSRKTSPSALNQLPTPTEA